MIIVNREVDIIFKSKEGKKIVIERMEKEKINID